MKIKGVEENISPILEQSNSITTNSNSKEMIPSQASSKGKLPEKEINNNNNNSKGILPEKISKEPEKKPKEYDREREIEKESKGKIPEIKSFAPAGIGKKRKRNKK